jgi:hypothetical protein
VRASLVWAVGEAGDRERLPFVRRGFASGDARLAGAAAAALLKLGETEEVVALVEDDDAERRHLAVAALAETGDTRWRKLLRAAARDPALRVRIEAVVGLSKMGAPEAFPFLLEGLASPSAMVWGACANELERAYGVEHGRNADAWAAWYRAHRDRLEWDAEKRVWRLPPD